MSVKILSDGTVLLPEDTLLPGQRYDFGDETVVDLLEEAIMPKQVPGYETMRKRCIDIGAQFVRAGSDVLDLGTSRGRVLRDLISHFASLDEHDLIQDVRYQGVDNQRVMLDRARRDTAQLALDLGYEGDLINYNRVDLRESCPVYDGTASLITAVLSVQFVPVEHRDRLMECVYESLAPGGAFILVEKVLPSSAITADILENVHLEEKRANGMSDEAVELKKLSIENFLVPKRSDENKAMLAAAGFNPFRIETFWRDLAFEAVVAVKR